MRLEVLVQLFPTLDLLSSGRYENNVIPLWGAAFLRSKLRISKDQYENSRKLKFMANEESGRWSDNSDTILQN